MRRLDFNIFDSPRANLAPGKGKVLIAEPFLQGPYFNRSIVLLTEYSEEGAVGFILNKSSDMYPDEVMDDLFSFKGELFIGGPVSSNTLHFLHTLGEEIPGAVQITQNVFWGGDFETIKEMVNKNLIDREKVKFFAGYSGWSPGQLEEEIDEKSWIVSSINENLIMSPSITNIWKETISNLGDIYKTWSNFPQNPTFN